MKKIKNYVANILNWLKDKKNLALVLFAILVFSIFKIAFFGINTYSIINTEENGYIETSTDATIHTAGNDPISVEKY